LLLTLLFLCDTSLRGSWCWWSPTHPPSPPINIHLMKTRSKSSINKSRLYPSTFLARNEPKGVNQALADCNWLSAMKSEYSALMKNHTGTWLICLWQAVGYKWVFYIKENADESLSKYKARLRLRNFIKLLTFIILFLLLLNS